MSSTDLLLSLYGVKVIAKSKPVSKKKKEAKK